ncbi:hypothetical protein GJAV_G00089120 [Gymnothorax javanicus]|nr:hypothetical protein GJAV_G00089120 [Gymnothorax javanicus]
MLQMKWAGASLFLGLLWVGICCCAGEGSEMKIPGLGKHCDGKNGGLCPTNLTCVPADLPGYGEDPSSGLCQPKVTPPECVPCSEVRCPMQKRSCPSFHVTEPCGCCPQCAKRRGEVCGGPYWGRGYCTRRLLCASFEGFTPVTPPETGVCKSLPGLYVDHTADRNCPWVWGCNIRMGHCDCYGVQSCYSLFSYANLQSCMQILKERWEYDLSSMEKEQQPVVVCEMRGCEVQEDQCVCSLRPCTPRPLSEDECEEKLKQIRCANVTCPDIPVPSCPPDSFLTKPYTPPHECCPLVPARCTCDFEKCPDKPSRCPPGQHLQNNTGGKGHPGNCCPNYSCGPDEEVRVAQDKAGGEDRTDVM